MGLLASVYRDDFSGTRCLLKAARQVVVLNAEGPYQPDRDRPGVVLARGAGGAGIVIALPADRDGRPLPLSGSSGPLMFGGAYIATSDSRFGEAVRGLGGPSHAAIPLHDWQESWQEYEHHSL